jgi:hypothetical protein
MVVGVERHLTLAVSGPHARAVHGHAPAAERDLAILVAVTDRCPVRVPLALRADDPVDLQLEQLVQNTEPDLNR